jgi:hypothetical protein
MDYLFHSTFAWLGLGGVSLVALGAVAYFFPPFRKLAIEAGAAVFTVMAIYGKGAADAKRRDLARQKAEEDAAILRATSNRNRADTDAASGVRDGYDRDK